eukprot:CAMPEP_0197034278 /NCGR_PEP_ID=MMETSP1384-20130603/12440_1 /TAXON_ID=29189 /ORGANISM="Ammonia sp." /LENGTH=563 /DNA_ID=CAMNT_0042464185 /DNA_START=22 /DNA_END=1713 /DNA_ORIENTATION=-
MSSKKKKVATSPTTNGKNTSKDKPKKKKSKKRPKVESDDKSKEQRRKILEFRRMQSRFVLPTIDDITESEPANIQPEDNGGGSSTDDAKLNEQDKEEQKQEEEDEEDEKEVLFVELPESQDDAINNLQTDFEEYDDDFFGFIEYDSFLRILKANKVNLSDKQETFLISSLTLIDEGVDYYGFLQFLRNRAAKAPNDNLTKICQQIAIDAEKKANQESEEKDKEEDEDIEVDEQELEKFYMAAKNARSRGMNLATMERTSMVIPSTNKIRQIIEQFALDGVEIDYAVLKTALAAINAYPKDEDLLFLINYLAYNEQQTKAETEKKEDEEDATPIPTEHPMDADDIFIDFNYFISFCQEVIGIPAILWEDPAKVIEKVAKQTRLVFRTQKRQKQDKLKAKKRLEYRKKMKADSSKQQSEKKAIEKEEKRLRALRLRERAKMVGGADTKSDEEKTKLKEWIKKRGQRNNKKYQKELQQWMQKNEVFQKWLYNELIAHEVTSLDILKGLSTAKMDAMLRKIRSDKFAQIKNQSKRNNIDKAMVAFEKKWRKIANVKSKKKSNKKSTK